MMIDYKQVSKADGKQGTDTQLHTLLTAGVDSSELHEDHALQEKNDWPQLAARLKDIS